MKSNQKTTNREYNIDNIKDKGFDKRPENINRKGRPRKVALQLKSQGYTLIEINDTIKAMCSMNIQELKKVYENTNSSILEKTIAAALQKGLQKGNLESIETLLNRVYGKPRQDLDIKSGGENINKPRIEINIIKTQVTDGEEQKLITE